MDALRARFRTSRVSLSSSSRALSIGGGLIACGVIGDMADAGDGGRGAEPRGPRGARGVIGPDDNLG